MNTLFIDAILIELVFVIGGFFIIKQVQKKQTKQPTLSKKIIRNLKF